MNRQIILDADPDDERDIMRAVTIHQIRVKPHDMPDGWSATLAARLGEICRDWIEYKAHRAE